MHQMIVGKKISAVAIALLVLSVASVGSLASSEAKAQDADPNCRSIAYYPGAVSVIGTAKGTADSGDFRDCRVTYQCDKNARTVRAVGYGIASPGSILAAETYAIASDSSEAILSSCEAVERSGRRSRACAGDPQKFSQETAVAETAECAVVVGTPANGKVVGTATCLCE